MTKPAIISSLLEDLEPVTQNLYGVSLDYAECYRPDMDDNEKCIQQDIIAYCLAALRFEYIYLLRQMNRLPPTRGNSCLVLSAVTTYWQQAHALHSQDDGCLTDNQYQKTEAALTRLHTQDKIWFPRFSKAKSTTMLVDQAISSFALPKIRRLRGEFIKALES